MPLLSIKMFFRCLVSSSHIFLLFVSPDTFINILSSCCSILARSPTPGFNMYVVPASFKISLKSDTIIVKTWTKPFLSQLPEESFSLCPPPLPCCPGLSLLGRSFWRSTLERPKQHVSSCVQMHLHLQCFAFRKTSGLSMSRWWWMRFQWCRDC